MKKDQLRDAIINLTIAEFPQPETPTQEIERRGYELARGMYAEAKLRLLTKLGL